MMKIFSTIVSLLLVASVFAQSGFEGQIQLTVNNPASSEKADITWFVKNGQHRLDYNTVAEGNSMNYSLVADNASAKMIAKDGSVINIPMETMNKGSYNLVGYLTTDQAKGQNVSGFNCAKYTIQTKEYMVEYWLSNETGLKSSDFPSFMQKGLFMPANELQSGSVPVKIVVKDLNGKVVYIQTITAITASNVDAAKFSN